MAEQLAVENGEKLQKVSFLKIVFCNIAPLGDPKKWSHMKIKSKISYLGERNRILPGQMAEQLAVEVDVKNVTEYRGVCKLADIKVTALLISVSLTMIKQI